MTAKPQGGLLWVTNLATPYRAPLWAALAEQQDLTVALLADTEPNRHWHVDLRPDLYTVESLHAKPMAHSGDSVIYAPSLRLLSLIWNRPRAVVIDGWESPAFLAARLLARVRRVPLIASYRSTQLTHRFNRGPVPALRRWFFRGSDLVLTAGAASTDAVLAMGIPRSQIVEGFNTVDVERFISGADSIRRTTPPRPGHHFIYVGQFVERKNVEMLIRAFAGMRDPLDTLTLVGSGPLEADLRAVIHQLGLDDVVPFAGHLEGDDLVAAYAAATTLVLPSSREVWGLVVNEALAAGLHVVVSTACGITASVNEMPAVFTTEPEVAELARAMRYSRSTWAGPTNAHPISLNTPAALSRVVLEATDAVSAAAVHGAN